LSLTEPSLETEYVRAYGQHNFVSVTGATVSAISQPTWEDFAGALEAASYLGNIILSPELITSSEELLKVVPDSRAEIEARVEETRQLSFKIPDTLIVLGTATFDSPSGRPANSQLFIQDGAVVAQNNKRYSYYPLEKRVFTMQQTTARPQSPSRRFVGMICSDLLGEGASSTSNVLSVGSDEAGPPPIVGMGTESVLFSSRWAVSVQSAFDIDQYNINREDWFRRALEKRMLLLFRKYPALREVIMCDSLISTSGVEDPFNAHITRKI